MLIAGAIVVAFVSAPPLGAQTVVRAVTPLLQAPGGRDVATVREGAAVRAAAARRGFTQVTLDGYIAANLVGSGRDSFPNSVRAQGGAHLREEGRANAPILADLHDGMGLTVISRRGDWIRIRRTGWVATSALGPAPRPSAATSAPQSSRPPPTPAPVRAESVPPPPALPPPLPQQGASLTPAGEATLRTAPDGDTVARLDSGAILVPVARDGGWTRVRIEGWVRDTDLVPADSSLRYTLSAADVRANPERARGAVVRWDVEFIALQTADALRRDMRVGERYILARGPGNESGILYVVVAPALVPQVERLEPLTSITITARIRVGQSEPVGVPILELISLVTG
jgi:hypothetical protein